MDARRGRYLRARLQLAHIPFVKNFDQFDFAFQPSIDERQIRELRTLRFIHEASNVIFLGPPGVGKTHLSVALAEAAIALCREQGFAFWLAYGTRTRSLVLAILGQGAPCLAHEPDRSALDRLTPACPHDQRIHRP